MQIKWDEWSDDFSRWETVHTAFLRPLRCFFSFSSMHSDYKNLVDFIKMKLELLSLRDRKKDLFWSNVNLRGLKQVDPVLFEQSKKNLVVWGYTGDEVLPIYVGIIS